MTLGYLKMKDTSQGKAPGEIPNTDTQLIGESHKVDEHLATDPPPIVDPKLESLFRPLTDDELGLLKGDMEDKHCCHDPLLVSKDGTLLDGYHRLKICQSLGIPYKTLVVDLRDGETAEAWRIRAHLGRRNFTPDQRRLAMVLLYGQEKHQGRRTDLTSRQNGEKLGAAERVSAVFGVSPRTVQRAAADIKILATDPEVQSKIWAGENISQIKFEKKRADFVEKFKDVRVQNMFEKKYPCIVIDFPWSEKKSEDEVTSEEITLDYPTMTREKRINLEVPWADDAWILFWTTQKYEEETRYIIVQWSLKYRFTMIWHKDGGRSPTGYPQFNHELVLCASRGAPKFIDTKGFKTCFYEERKGHSRKPDIFYDMVRKATVGPRLDMFGRREIPGFDSWGFEAPDRSISS